MQKYGNSELFLRRHIKKTDKTPQSDLDKAERLRKLYFELKENKK